jgi:elongation factor Ts
LQKGPEKAGGDIEKAIDMRASGAIKAAKRLATSLLKALSPSRPTVSGPAGVNSQTDFLALDDFKNFVAASVEKAFADKLTDAARLIALVKLLVKYWSPSWRERQPSPGSR